MNFGDLSSIKGLKDNHGVSSEEEQSEETNKEVKKPRLGGNSETQEKDDNRGGLEEGNIADDDKTNDSEDLSKEKVGNKDDNKGIGEEDNKDDNKGIGEGDNIFRILSDLHEDVPLEDPGPKIAIEDGKEGDAGATQ